MDQQEQDRDYSRHDDERRLTDADVHAIVAALESRVVERFYGDIGKGIWALAWKTIILGLIALAAYGVGKGH